MKWKTFLPVIGIAIFIYILIKLNLYEIINEIKNANILLLIIAVSFVILLLFMQTFKWFFIAIKQGINIPFMEAFKINFISNFYGFITPSKLGTVIRVEYLKKYTFNFGKGLCNFTIDKVLDMASIIFTAILFSFVFRDKFNLPIHYFIAFFFLIIFLIYIFVNKQRSKAIFRIFYKRFVPEKMKDKARITFESFYEDMPKKRYFILFFFFNILSWFVIYLTTYFIGLSLGINLPLIYFLAIIPIGTLVSMIPISINGLGTREAALISLFGIFGISAAKVFSMSIITILITGVIPSIIASFLIFKKRI